MNRNIRSLPVTVMIAAKFAKVLSVLKVAKFTKLLVMATSMLVSVVAYGLTFGPWFGVGLVAMVFIHEMGHVIAMRRRGYKTALPVFIPFLGAAIFVPDFGDRETEAYIGYGGPLLGSIGAFACIALWWATGSPLILLIAYLGVYINLFNLIPVRPLDGGRITQLLGANVKYAAMALLVGYTIYLGEPSLLLVWILVLQEFQLPLWWRPISAGFLAATMTLLFYQGYGVQIWEIDLIDVLVASAFIFLYVIADRHRAKTQQFRRASLAVWEGVPGEESEAYRQKLRQLLEPEQQPYPPVKTRLSWAVIYLASVATLWISMAYLLEYLPH